MQHTNNLHQRYLEGVPLFVYEIALYNFHPRENLLQTDLDRWLFANMDETLSNVRDPDRFDMYKTIDNLEHRCGHNMALRRFYALLNINNMSPITKSSYETLEAKIGGFKVKPKSK